MAGISYKAQDNTLAASVNSPAAYQTGVPDISFPLVSLPATKDMTINFGLAYNANAYKKGSFSGPIAKYWALTGSNFTITRNMNNDSPDEIETIESEGLNGYWNDIYYYNLNGEQGSFKFEKNGLYPNDTYKIIKLTSSNLIIECERITTTWSGEARIIKSFTVTDSKGYKYYFTDYDQSNLVYFTAYGGHPTVKLRNTFYVTRIEDASKKTVVTFTNTLYSNDTNDAWYYLPEKITTDYGSINFEHGDSNEGNSYYDFPAQDRYFISSITLKDHKGVFISKNKLNIASLHDIYQTPENPEGHIWYRVFGDIKKVDKNDQVLDKITFGYKTYANDPYGTSGIVEDKNMELLNSISFSSGKKIEYNFGFQKIKNPVDVNSPSFIASLQNTDVFINGINYYKKVDSMTIDTNNNRIFPLRAANYSFSKTKIIIGLSRTLWYPNGPIINPSFSQEDLPMQFDYRLVDGSTGKVLNHLYNYPNTYIVEPSHNLYLEVMGSGGKGYFDILEKRYKSPPYDDMITVGTPVVNSMELYDITEGTQPSNTYNTYDLKKSIIYDYNLFDDSMISSGIQSLDQDDVFIYKNIKITESDKSGNTKYYFKSGDDYPSHIFNNELAIPHFNLVKNGLLEKKEVYDVNNIKRNETKYDYSFPTFDESKQYMYSGSNDRIIYTSESFFDKITTTDITYDANSNSLTDISEKSFNQTNNNLMSEKRTAADGTVSETTYQYAAEKNNTKLLSANMFSVPLEVTQKQNNMAIGKLETRYDQTGNYFPSSVKSFGINNVITGEQVNNHYDILGNVLQTTSKTGVPTAIIWGYNGTQPIAKIEGAEYFNVLSLLGEPNVNLLDIVQRSNQDISSTDNTNEQLLRDALEAFRKKPEFKNYLITTYTYDPLIGVKSMTTPNGFTEYYYYDNQNRPTRVEDGDHHIIRENRYQQNVFQNAN